MAAFGYRSLTGWHARARIRMGLLVAAERTLKAAEKRLARVKRRDKREGHPRPRPRLEAAVVAARKKVKVRREQRHDALAVIRRHTTKFERWMLNGHPGNVTPGVKAAIVRMIHYGDGRLFVTSTTDGSHATTSFHYWKPGRAVDVGTAPDDAELKPKFQRHELARGAKHYAELFGPDNDACVKNGQRITLGEGTPLETLHDTHVHIAPA